jgi:hypothetical protein
MSEEPTYDVTVRDYVISLCQACIDGLGSQCHTPACALCRHSVDLPIWREALTEVEPIWDQDKLAGYRVVESKEVAK